MDTKKVRDVILGGILLLVFFLMGCIALRWAKEAPLRRVNIQVDTLYIHDSIIVDKPIKVTEYKTRIEYIPVPDMCVIDSLKWELDSMYWANCSLAYRNDSLMLALQLTQAHYHEDSLYDAWVSGWHPQLDSIKVYTKERLIIRTETTEIARKWGFGVSAGPGVFVDLGGKMHFGGGIIGGFYYNF